ncbi:MAG TPA: alkaline phosphatase family protein [Solirubrobacteraceae bacterium]|nr:alkaline phosphatase family protein [Solirubrobacteraceae bacterium]
MSGKTNSGFDNIEHIVVLMLENRSFDHMLGYLSLEGSRDDIEGLRPDMHNMLGDRRYTVHHLASTHLPNEHWDLDHSGTATDEQIKGGAMDGFVSSYAAKLAREHVPNPDPGIAMGYYNAADLPVYDHLAEHFCVCDQWHSSIPGATWPNRLYAVAGSAAGSRDDRKPPLYDKHSFVRHLDAAGVSWRWYSYDIGSLRCVDAEYLLGHHEHFAYVQKLKLAFQAHAEQELLIDEDAASFLEDAARGRLPAVSWIDPNFKDFNLIGSPPNDDHPPSDVQQGQELVLLVYNALASGPQWDKTLLLIVYDEHGGFFDHVPPPENPPDDDPKTFARYGVRVPALVVSPWISQRKVSKTLFDHATIIKTILGRFCPSELQKRTGTNALVHWLEDESHPHYMGKRVAAAADLGGLLDLSEPRPAPDRSDLVDWLAKRQDTRIRRLLEEPAGMLRPAEEHTITDLQAGILAATQELHKKGHPVGQP